MANETVLVIDDEQLIRRSVSKRLSVAGYNVLEAEDGRSAVERAALGVDLAILDYRLPDMDGLTVLKQIRQIDPDVLVILLTAYASVETAVEAMKLGAYHFMNKPFDLEALAAMVEQALETTRLRREVRQLRANQAEPYSLDRMVGDSPELREFKGLVRRVAASPASTVLLTGESGTGKDLTAKIIHYSSTRATRPFVNITCSALPETLLESELFGHERGAFTDARQQKKGLLEQADGGTVFLDEIGEMTAPLQAKLLRFLEEKTFRRVGGSADVRVDVRVIAATNRTLEEEVRQGRFREDLFYRLNVLPLKLPPLRTHIEDVPALVSFYIDIFNREFKKNVRGASPATLKSLAAYGWPGNVRELRNAVERAMLMVSGDTLEPGDFPIVSGTTTGGHPVELPASGLNLDDIERSFVVQALERTGWNQTRAAKLLGLNRDQIHYRIEKFKLAQKEA
ncbi:MAG: sigma-54-dependent Fis family transcriptional regulator [Acidobacteria bacterium]|nr:MAG: sigma-54-dependent Fis family transcriptional regulator [Acidobacteriota bacterium]